jgi:hypothetical protein
LSDSARTESSRRSRRSSQCSPRSAVLGRSRRSAASTTCPRRCLVAGASTWSRRAQRVWGRARIARWPSSAAEITLERVLARRTYELEVAKGPLRDGERDRASPDRVSSSPPATDRRSWRASPRSAVRRPTAPPPRAARRAGPPVDDVERGDRRGRRGQPHRSLPHGPLARLCASSK